LASFCTARLSPDFHHNHTPSPLAGLCSAPLHAQVSRLFQDSSLSKNELLVQNFIGLVAYFTLNSTLLQNLDDALPTKHRQPAEAPLAERNTL
jgi:hypothetical protein